MHLEVPQVEKLALALAVLLAFSLIWLSPAGTRAAHAFRGILQSFARKRSAAAFSIAAAVMLLRVALLPVWKIPVPSVPDEFSHLLVGDTLASGRLTNPPHPMWVHFETAYELMWPTYASAYPPAQGVFLAAGEAITGRPWWGVWLSAGLMSAAFCWMFQQWLPPLWAMAAGIWAAFQLGLLSYWMNSYWGGAVSAMGGALVIGAAGQLRHGLTGKRTAVLAAGMAILGLSRPYEGAVLALAASVWVAIDILKRRKWPPLHALLPAILPGVAVLAVFAAALGYYCWRVTGSPLELPQAAYIKQYAVTKAFVWQKAPAVEPDFHHPVLAAEMRSFLLEQQQYDSPAAAILWTLWKAVRIGTFYLGPLLLIPLVMLPWLWRGRFRGVVIMAAASITGILLTVFLELHYAAPMSGLLFLMAAQSLRMLWAARRYENPLGRFLVPAAPAVALLTMILTATPPAARASHIERAKMIERLRQTPEKHLIIVRYGSVHSLPDEWVFNDAGIDQSPVVWARDMGDKNREIIQYFHDRKIWYLDVDAVPPALSAYTPEAPASLRK